MAACDQTRDGQAHGRLLAHDYAVDVVPQAREQLARSLGNQSFRGHGGIVGAGSVPPLRYGAGIFVLDELRRVA